MLIFTAVTQNHGDGLMEPPRISVCTLYFYFLETRIIGLHFAADSMGLSSFFSVGSAKLFYFRKSDVSGVQGHPRSLILVHISPS